MMLARRQSKNTVFNNNDCAIDNEAKIQRAQTHQVGTHFRFHHPRNQHKHGQWNDHRGEQSRSKITKHHQEHNDDKNGPLQQIGLHRGYCLIHQDRAVIDRCSSYP